MSQSCGEPNTKAAFGLLFRTVLLNRLRLQLADWRFLAAMVLVPLLLSAVAGNALDRLKDRRMSLLVADQDGSASSVGLIEALSSKAALLVKVATEADARRRVEENQAEALLIIPDGYGARFLAGERAGLLTLVTAASADSRGFLTELVAGEVFRLAGANLTWDAIRAAFPDTADAAMRREVFDTYQQVAGKTWLDIRYEVIRARTPAEGTVNYPAAVAASLGMTVLFLMFGMIFGAGWFVEDRRNGTLARMHAARGTALAWYAANGCALFLCGCFLLAALIGGATLLAGTPPIRGIASWLVLLCYLACLASLGMLLASVFRSAANLQAATPVVSILSGFAGGCLWNQMGQVGTLPLIAKATPQGWTLQALGALYADPLDTGWRQSALVLLGAAAVMSACGWVLTRRQQRQGP